MNKLLALVTLAVCVVIASTSHLDARSETPPRAHGDHHYQLQQHHNHHNHKSQSAAAVAAIAAAAHGRSAALDAVDSSRTAAGGAAVIPSTDERPLRLRRWNYDGNTQHRRSYHRTGRNFETRRGIGSGAPEVPSNPGWQLDWTGKNIATRRSGGSGGGVPSVFSSKPIWETRYNSTRSLSDSGLGYAGSAPTTDGKEGIMRDVEHISGDTLNNEWMHRMEPELVTLPPTTTTTTSTTTTTTERPYGTGFGGRKGGGFDGRTDSKGLDSRHICMQQRTLQVPVKSVEVYQRPIWKHISHPCPTQTNQSNQMCTRVQLAHEPVYRDVIRHKTTKQMVLECCSGWTRVTKSANGCMKPVCSSTCRNGGTCIGPDTCSCPQGYGGKYCEKDINECKEEKPCDQLCFNTEGSFYCQCREGFVLQADKQSCKKIDNHDDDAFEARDLENEVDSNEVTLRLHKIEKSLANERVTTNELQKSLQATYTVVDSLKNRLTTLEKQQQDVNHLQTNLMATETRTRKLENMISILLKCRNSPGPYCS